MNRQFRNAIFAAGLIFLSACSVTKRAQHKMEKGQYDVAISLLKGSIDKGDNVAENYYTLAEAYRLSNRLDEAMPFYEAAIKNGYTEPEALYHLGFAYKNNGDYEQAEQTFQEFVNKSSDPKLKSVAQEELKNLEEIHQLSEPNDYYKVKELNLVNTKASDYAPVYQDGYLYFTSSRGDGKVYKATGENFSDIYKAKTKGAVVDTTTIRPLPPQFNEPNANEGTVTFSPDGRIMIFAKGNTGKRKDFAEVHLFISFYRNNQWSAPRMMNINQPGSWDSSPAFSADGRTLYFSSNRPGGFGGIDLYSATMNARGIWGNVHNLGPEINTPRDEMFPFASQDGKLYFASNGHMGIGGLDLFVAQREHGKITIEHLPPPMNSNKDDFSLFLFSPDKGFFSSNRPGGTGRDDIYTFRNEDPNLKIVNYYLTGLTKTYGENDSTELILPGTRVRLFSKDSLLLSEVVTGQDAKFRFRVDPEENYMLVADKNGYFTTRDTFSTVGKSLDKTQLTELVTNKIFNTEILLRQIVIDKAIELKNIYYDFDKANIRPDAAKELDKLVTLLKDNPEIKIELSSHTDARGDAAYNMELSQRRADSAVAYIVKHGIDPNRITARGYGESRLIIKDAQTEAQHAINRRTEFKVTDFDRDLFIKRKQQEEEDFRKGTLKIEEEVKPQKEDDVFDFGLEGN